MKFIEAYTRVRQIALKSGFGSPVTQAMMDTLGEAKTYLTSANRLALQSAVSGKEYLGYQAQGKRSRAINQALFDPSDDWIRVVEQLFNNQRSGLSPIVITRSLYTAAISFCAAVDLVKERDQKTPETFFECLVGGLVFAITGV